KQKQQGGLGADGLASMLGQERQRVEQAAPGAGSLLTSVLDSDGDGQIGDDLAKIGGNLLGSFLSGRR
ncbi:MAG: calcium-binding protein, partial [Acidobacteriota bacterium]